MLCTNFDSPPGEVVSWGTIPPDFVRILCWCSSFGKILSLLDKSALSGCACWASVYLALLWIVLFLAGSCRWSMLVFRSWWADIYCFRYRFFFFLVGLPLAFKMGFLSLQIVMVIIVVRLAFRQTKLSKHTSIYFVKCVFSLFDDKLSWSMGRADQLRVIAAVFP